jgi:uncharacterized protein with HEPN domain
MKRDDHVRVRHMIDATELAMGFVEGRSRPVLATDQMLRWALVHAAQAAGEAASKVADEGKTELADSPWAAFLWNTVTEPLPALLTRLRASADSHAP